jgi:very-short-patch-repair endonuclease
MNPEDEKQCMSTIRRVSQRSTNCARALRSGMTDAEQRLWNSIRGKQLLGHKFRRQHPIAPCIADFACLELKLVIELDGGQHQAQVTYDERRTAFMRMHGWTVLRFWNNDVLGNLEGVLATIADALNTRLIEEKKVPFPLQGEG